MHETVTAEEIRQQTVRGGTLYVKIPVKGMVRVCDRVIGISDIVFFSEIQERKRESVIV
jgi:hypothetical protein